VNRIGVGVNVVVKKMMDVCTLCRLLATMLLGHLDLSVANDRHGYMVEQIQCTILRVRVKAMEEYLFKTR
jgi:hypothetical protein